MLYRKLMQELKERIESEEFPIGTNLPTEKDLTFQYDVSRVTVRKAIAMLSKLGLVKPRRGAGTIVIGKTVTGSMSTLRSSYEYMESAGGALQYELVEFKLIECNEEVASALELEKGSKVYFIKRFKKMNNVVYIYEDSYMPVTLFPTMSIPALEGSKYHYVEKELGMEIDGAMQDFEITMPSEHECFTLDLPDEPIFRLLTTGYLKGGQVFEYTKMSFKPDTYSFKHYVKRG